MRDLIGTRRVLLGVLAVSVLIAITALAVPLLTAHRKHPGAAPAGPSPAPSTSPVPVPSGALSLVQGARLADGIEVGYPHSIVGAVSAAAEDLDAVASTLDPDYAASVMRVAGDPADPALPGKLASSTVKLRADLQLPTSGPLGPPVAFQTTAQMYQLRDATTNDVLVLLLAAGTFTNAQGGIAQTTGVFPVHMRWAAGDWKLTAIGGDREDFSGLDATPDTTEATGHGWKALISPVGGGGS